MLFPQKSVKLLFFLFLWHIKEPTYSLCFVTTSNSYQGIANLLCHQNLLVTADNFWLPIVFMHIHILNIIVVQCLSHVRLFTTPWTAALQASLSFTISGSWLRFMFNEWVMLYIHLILFCCLLLCLQSFPESGSFLMSRLFVSGGQSFQWIFMVDFP